MILLFLTLLCYPLIISPATLPYAEWAHYHMIWLSNDRSNQVNVQAMFDDYNNHQIPFGALNIDSCWASNFNTFIFNSTLFPSAREMLNGFRAKNTRIILWMTSFVNIDSPNYQFAQDHGFLFNKTLKWWHGEGRLLNYFNEQALEWWNNQIKTLIDTVGPIHAFKVCTKNLFLKKYLIISLLKGGR
jgi:alpha-glucosidase (family GH31 glycosyl hydrolase)